MVPRPDLTSIGSSGEGGGGGDDQKMLQQHSRRRRSDESVFSGGDGISGIRHQDVVNDEGGEAATQTIRRGSDNDRIIRADRRGTNTLRGSALIPRRATKDIDWFAAKGLMSAKSKRRLMKEKKKEEKEVKKLAVKEAKKKLKSSIQTIDSADLGDSFNKVSIDGSNRSSNQQMMDGSNRSSSGRLSDSEHQLDAYKNSNSRSTRTFHTALHEYDLDDDGNLPDNNYDDDDDGDDDSLNLQDIAPQQPPQDRISTNNDPFPNHRGPIKDFTYQPSSRNHDSVSHSAKSTRTAETTLSSSVSSAAIDIRSSKTSTTTVENQRLSSSLICNDAAHDASWFANRGLMSRKSMKLFKKEMKKNKNSKTKKPEPLIELDELSISSEISGLNQSESKDSDDVPIISATTKEQEEEKKCDDGVSRAGLSSHRSDTSSVSFRERVSEIISEEDFGEDDGRTLSEGTIQVPKKFIDDISMLDIDWNTSSRTLQDHWANSTGDEDDDGDDDSGENVDTNRPSSQLSHPPESPLKSSLHSEGSESIDVAEAFKKIDVEHSSANTTSGTASHKRQSILRTKTPRISVSSSEKRVSFIGKPQEANAERIEHESTAVAELTGTTPTIEIKQRPSTTRSEISALTDFHSDHSGESESSSYDHSDAVPSKVISKSQNDKYQEEEDVKAASRPILPKNSRRNMAWFASQGLMSKRTLDSHKRRKKQLKKSHSHIGATTDGTPRKVEERKTLSSSLQTGLDKLDDSDEEERNRLFADLIQSMLTSERERQKSGLSPDEVIILDKMVKRLSSGTEDDINNASDNPRGEEDPIALEDVEKSFAKSNTTKRTSESQAHAEMLAKVARGMSASLERSRAFRSTEDTDHGSNNLKLASPTIAQIDGSATNNTANYAAGMLAKVANDMSAKLESSRVSRSADLQIHSLREDRSTNNAVKEVEPVKQSHPTQLLSAKIAIPVTEEFHNSTVSALTTNTKFTLQALIQDDDEESVLAHNTQKYQPESPHTSPKVSAHGSDASGDLCPDSVVKSDSDLQQSRTTDAAVREILVNNSTSSFTAASTESHEDILSLGMNILSVTMLVNIYGRLREMSLLGNASVKLREIDVNSHQRNSRMKELKRLKLLTPEEENKGYLETTLTAGYIVRTAIDEYEMFESSSGIENGALCNVKRASLEYSATMVSDFKAWVAESLTKKFNGDCFEKGSVMRNLTESGLEVVWISDRHPSDVSYCICINRITSSIIVVFRGDESVLQRVKDSKMMEHENPLADDFKDTDYIKLRAAVSKKILTPRLDTKMNIVDEIHHRVEKIRRELTGRDPCHLTICGHSLGGGMAAVTGFYLACKKELNLTSPIQVVTFASPRVGGHEFQRSFHRLEDSGRILYARFTSENDLISLRPFLALSGSWKFEDWYRHVGMHVCLGGIDQGFNLSYRQLGFPEELMNLIKSYFCGHSKRSSILEYHRRLSHARKEFLSRNKRLSKRKQKTLITLQECYSLHESFEVDGNMKGSSSLIKYALIAIFISIEIGLLLRMIMYHIESLAGRE